MIVCYVKGQELKINQPIIAADSINYLEAQFIFKTSDWDGLAKYAHFKQGDTVYDVPLTDNHIRREDGLNLGAGTWSVYLHGNATVDGEVVERITTHIAEIAVKPSGVLNGEPFPSALPSISEQILAMIGDMEELETVAKDTLVDAINEAAESGGGGVARFIAEYGVTTKAEVDAAFMAGDIIEVDYFGAHIPLVTAAQFQPGDTPLAYLFSVTSASGDGAAGIYFQLDSAGWSEMETTLLQAASITDAGGYYTTDTVEGALQEIGAELAGINTLIGSGVIE